MSKQPARSTPSRLGLFALVPLVLFAFAAQGTLSGRLPLAARVDWIPSLGISLGFHADALSMLMVLLITGIGSLVFVYAAGYMAGVPRRGRMFGLLLAFMVAMIGCVTADNLIVLFLFWEATSVLSFLLVGFNHEVSASRKSAQQALMITGTGGLAMLAGFTMLGEAAGTYTVSEIVDSLPNMAATPPLTAALVLILVGAFTKSAQFPFHFWLPNAMAAPTPVSALLHAVAVVKAGVFTVLKVTVYIFGTDFILQSGASDWLVWFAGATILFASLVAMTKDNLKARLAYSTVSQLSYIVLGALLLLPALASWLLRIARRN